MPKSIARRKTKKAVAKRFKITASGKILSSQSGRRHLAGSLRGVLALNERQGREDVAVFEIGKGYGRVGDAPLEWTRLALVIAGNSAPRDLAFGAALQHPERTPTQCGKAQRP